MRKPLFTRLKTLLTTARLIVYTKRSASAKPKFSTEPNPEPEVDAVSDDWMFESEAALTAYTDELASEMDDLASGLSGLRETLALISGDMPFPVEATTQMPCAIAHHDEDLFDGEIALAGTRQDATIGGEADFLFEDELIEIEADLPAAQQAA